MSDIRYVIVDSSLGLVLVAAGDAGLRAVLLGDGRADLLADLRRRNAGATIAEGGDELREIAARVVACIERPGEAPADLPLDPRGTRFQLEVWRALRAIPPGTTTTYAELAARLGRPAAVRAVAGACAANALAVLVPCHRVLRRDGALSGYRWGVHRKRALLDREGVPRPSLAPTSLAPSSLAEARG